MKAVRKFLMVAALAGLMPLPLFACAACGGAHSESPLAQGMNWGIFTLMAFIGTVLAGIALFFVHIVRKDGAANSNPSPPDRPAEL
jgi:succinate-acetate transporter protein